MSEMYIVQQDRQKGGEEKKPWANFGKKTDSK